MVKEPLIYEVSKRFNVSTNIRQATVSDDLGLVALEIEGTDENVEKAVKFFTEKGVKVEPIELDIVE